MKRIAIGCGVTVALLNILLTRITFALAQLASQALVTPLDANPAGTVLFIRFWWWPLLFGVAGVAAIVTPWCRRDTSRLFALLVLVLMIEVIVLSYAYTAFVVPLSHVPTPAMIKQGVFY